MPQHQPALIDDASDGYFARLSVAGSLTARFFHDPDCEQPYHGDDTVRIVVLHRRYIDPSRGACGSTPDDVAAWEAENADAWFTIPLFLYDHSGTVYRTGRSNPFHCPWDSGRVGIVALKRSDWLTGLHHAPTLEDQAAAIAEAYSHWANGETYGYTLVDRDGNELNSCSGFLGLDSAIAEARAAAEASLPKAYEIQHHTQCDGWLNTWAITEVDGSETLETFPTIAAAQAALDEFFDDVQDEIEAGQREADQGYDRSEFRIVEVGTA
jgi:hypothetical protein